MKRMTWRDLLCITSFFPFAIVSKSLLARNRWEVEKDDTVECAKHRIAEKRHIPPDHQILIFVGQRLQDNRFIRSYNKVRDPNIFLYNSPNGRFTQSED